MDKASAYGAGDCRFESCRVHWCRWHTCHQTRFDRFSYDYSPTPAMSWCFVDAKRKICPHSGSNLHPSRCQNRNSYLIVYAPGSRQPGPEKKTQIDQNQETSQIQANQKKIIIICLGIDKHNCIWTWTTSRSRRTAIQSRVKGTTTTSSSTSRKSKNHIWTSAPFDKPIIHPMRDCGHWSHGNSNDHPHANMLSLIIGLLHLSRICNIVPERSIVHQSYSRSIRTQ